MNARAEGAVRISKSKMCSAQKRAHAPLRTYGWWPNKAGVVAWEELKSTDMPHHCDSNLKPWACYATGYLPREHPDVKDTTNGDRAVEGAFMMWDDLTPTAWIYSFRHRSVIRCCDLQFRTHEFPFADPSVLVNKQSLSAEQIDTMHAEDDTTVITKLAYDNELELASETGELD
eukprot:2761157-Rhodomonas_salina.1